MRDKILIYNDIGVADTGDLQRCLKNYFLPQGVAVELVTADDILHKGVLNEGVAAFFIPGGAATPYMNKLKVLGNQKIRDYVAAGGVYFGICAGAYYAAESLSFEADVPELALEQRCGLDLIKAHARGTLKDDFGLMPYIKPTVANAAIVKIIWQEDCEEHSVFYHGGPKFENVSDAEVLAVYKDAKGQPPAIMLRHYGKGLAVVSGVHFEDDAKSLEAMLKCRRAIKERAAFNPDDIKKGETSRQRLFQKLMARAAIQK